MAERDARTRGRRRAVLSALLAALLVGGVGLLVVRPEAGEAPRRWVKAVDRTVLGGALHRWLTGDPPTRDEHLEVPPAPPGAYAWARGGPGGEARAGSGDGALLAIAHRLGPPEAGGPNTLAAYRRARELGFRVFEVDLTLTADGVLACYHGQAGEMLDTLTWEGYRARSGRAACRFADLVEAARADPEARFVLDVKNRFDDAYDRIRAEIGEDGPGGSFIPQIYHFGQASRFRSNPFFAGILFTAYRSALSLEDVFENSRRAGIEVVTVPAERMAEWRGPLPDMPLVLVHPVNDAGLALRLRARGVDGIYTAYLSPPILRQWTGDPP